MGENVYAFPPASLRTKIETLVLIPVSLYGNFRGSNQEGDLVVYGRSVLKQHLITQLGMWMSIELGNEDQPDGRDTNNDPCISWPW
jgi:hypothetical protein